MGSRRVHITLPEDIVARLQEHAYQERRPPKEQIEWFVIQAVRGLDRAEKNDSPGVSGTGGVTHT
jgi:hypothetical protein